MKKRYFGTDGVRGKYGEEPLDHATIRKLGFVIAKYFVDTEGYILIGKDTRASGKEILEDLRIGLGLGGKESRVLNGDVAITSPATALLVREDENACAGIMITASHNPASDNGLKVLGADGDKLSDDIELKLEEMLETLTSEELNNLIEAKNEFSEDEILGCEHEYASLLKKALKEDFGFNPDEDATRMSLSIALDSAAGAGFKFTPWVIDEFGLEAEEVGKTPDGTNINDECGVLHPDNLMARVREGDYAFGLALDGDADRVKLVDETGRLWDGDRIIALLAVWLREREKLLNNTVVMTEYSNLSAINYLIGQGIKVEKVVVGDKEVLMKEKELGAVLGGEKAGHIIYRPWLSSSDGTFMAVWVAEILREKGCKLSELWPNYDEYPSEQFTVYVKEKKELSEIVGFKEAMKEASGELGNKGRVFVRYSGTENKMRILIESDDMTKVEKIGKKLSEIVKEQIGVEK